MSNPINWDVVFTLFTWWNSLNAPIQIALFGVTIYTTWLGVFRLCVQLLRGTVIASNCVCRWWTAFRAWQNSPSHADLLNQAFNLNIVRVNGIEQKLADLLIKLGEKPR